MAIIFALSLCGPLAAINRSDIGGYQHRFRYG